MYDAVKKYKKLNFEITKAKYNKIKSKSKTKKSNFL